MWIARVYQEGNKSLLYDLNERSPLRIGRAPDNDIVIPFPFTVSRYHAELKLSNSGDLIIVSTGRNGTRINDRIIPDHKPIFVNENDQIRLAENGPNFVIDEISNIDRQTDNPHQEIKAKSRNVSTMMIPFMIAIFLLGFVMFLNWRTKIEAQIGEAERRINSVRDNAIVDSYRQETAPDSFGTDQLRALEEELRKEIESSISREINTLLDSVNNRQTQFSTESADRRDGFPVFVMRSVFLVGAADQTNTITKVGTGFAFGRTGIIVTNEHVVEGATTIYVQREGDFFPARLLKSDKGIDIAILSVPWRTEALEHAQYTDDAIGETVFAVGFPWYYRTGGRATITRGIVSGSWDDRQFVITDALINPGNSGGPLVNSRGKVIGVNTFVIDTPAEKIGLAVNIEKVIGMLRN